MNETKNLCEPIILDEVKAMLFCNRNVCGTCWGTIQPTRFEPGLFIIQCVRCGATIREGDAVTKEALERIEQNKRIGEQQMRDPLKISREQAIKDLGFD